MDNRKNEEKREIKKEEDEDSADESGQNLDLKEFDPVKQFKIDGFIIVSAQRRYGKTIWIRWVLSKLWNFFAGGAYVFTKTKHNRFWSQHIPQTRIYNGLAGDNMDILQMILEKQKEKHEKMVMSGKFSSCPYVLIILDDVIGGKF